MGVYPVVLSEKFGEKKSRDMVARIRLTQMDLTLIHLNKWTRQPR